MVVLGLLLEFTRMIVVIMIVLFLMLHAYAFKLSIAKARSRGVERSFPTRPRDKIQHIQHSKGFGAIEALKFNILRGLGLTC